MTVIKPRLSNYCGYQITFRNSFLTFLGDDDLALGSLPKRRARSAGACLETAYHEATRKVKAALRQDDSHCGDRNWSPPVPTPAPSLPTQILPMPILPMPAPIMQGAFQWRPRQPSARSPVPTPAPQQPETTKWLASRDNVFDNVKWGPSHGVRDSVAERPDTSLMVRNIACRYKHEEVVRILMDMGLYGNATKVYLPLNAARRANLGYFFLNLNGVCLDFAIERLHGKTFGPTRSRKTVEVSLSHHQMGSRLSSSEDHPGVPHQWRSSLQAQLGSEVV
jgi:hypothetical protein